MHGPMRDATAGRMHDKHLGRIHRFGLKVEQDPCWAPGLSKELLGGRKRTLFGGTKSKRSRLKGAWVAVNVLILLDVLAPKTSVTIT